MGRRKSPGLKKRGRIWWIDKRIKGYGRLAESCRTDNLEEAEQFLAFRLNEIRQATVYGNTPLNYVEQLHRYESQTKKAGLSRLHGLRHGYAQRRYLELTGLVCAVGGGLSSKEQNPEQRALDHKARVIVSRELGHSREAISAAYLGR